MFASSSDQGGLLDHGRISRDEELDMMADYLGVDLEDAMRKFEKTKGCHARFEFLKKIYRDKILRVKEARGYNEQVGLYRVYAMRAYLLYLFGTTIFMDKSATYTNIVYLWYFEDFKQIHEYNGGSLCSYLCSKFLEGCI